MDWLEEFFPFLRELDQGSGTLEVALVVLIIAIIGVVGFTAVRRSRAGTAEAGKTSDPDAQQNDRDAG